jgi:hypothetical protein
VCVRMRARGCVSYVRIRSEVGVGFRIVYSSIFVTFKCKVCSGKKFEVCSGKKFEVCSVE